MKILLKFESSHFTEELGEIFDDFHLEVEWELPFIPNKGDWIDLSYIIDKEQLPCSSELYDLIFKDLIWKVKQIQYGKLNNVLMPGLSLKGFWGFTGSLI